MNAPHFEFPLNVSFLYNMNWWRCAIKVGNLELLHISVRGVVQGVGFRPFVYQLATKHNLKGWVCNTSGDVKIEVEGEKPALDSFLDDLVALAPPLARLEDVSVASHAPQGIANAGRSGRM